MLEELYDRLKRAEKKFRRYEGVRKVRAGPLNVRRKFCDDRFHYHEALFCILSVDYTLLGYLHVGCEDGFACLHIYYV